MQYCFASAVRLLSSPCRNNAWTKGETLIFHCFSYLSSFGPSSKRSKSLFTAPLLPLDQAQSARSPYSLLFFFLWTAQPGTSRVIASTCNQQRDHLNQTLFPLWGFEVLSLSLLSWMNPFGLTFRWMTYEISSSGHLTSELTNYKCNLVLVKIVCFKVG